MKKLKHLPFTVDGQLIGELGQRLVTRNHVALAELIKNSYDADATSVAVSFGPLKNSEGIQCAGIQITDNGLGMSMDILENNWMRIATANKQTDPISTKYGRPRTGSKGIGRFSCERLARHLNLTTTSSIDGELHTIEAWFNWDEFKVGTNLAEIPIAFARVPSNSRSTGTTLRLVALRDDWTQSQFDTLARAVISLTVTSSARRKGYQSDPGVAIKLDSDNFTSPTSDLFERLIDTGWGRIRGRISANGQATTDIMGKYIAKPTEMTLSKKYPNLAGMTFDIGFLRDGEGYDLNRDTSTLTRKLLNELRDQGGVRVYFEGFRVYPYGEPENDWLKLDADYARRKSSFVNPAYRALADSMSLNPKDVGLLTPRNANVLGRVYLDKHSASHMTTKMSREGFTDSSSLNDLITILRDAIEWTTVHYAFAREQHSRQKRNEAEQQFAQAMQSEKGITSDERHKNPLESALAFLAQSATSALPASNSTPQRQADRIALARSVITENLDAKEREISRLRTLASTAPLLFTFTHEVYSLINQLDTYANAIRNIAKRQQDQRDAEALNGAAIDLSETGDSFRAVASLFGVLTTTKDLNPKRYYARQLLQGLIRGTRFALKESAIEVTLVCDRDTKTPRMQKAEFVSVAVNLYVNALKSTMAAKGRRIEIRCFHDGARFVFELVDQGVGLAKQYRTAVFEPFISDPEHKIYSHLVPEGKLRGAACLGQ